MTATLRPMTQTPTRPDARTIRGEILVVLSLSLLASAAYAIVSLFQALASTQPVVLLVRDIQWCDPFTLRLLDLLAGSGLTVPILIVLTNHSTIGSTTDSRLHKSYPRITAA